MGADYRNLLITKEPINFNNVAFDAMYHFRNIWPTVHCEFNGLHLYFMGSSRLSVFSIFSDDNIVFDHKVCGIDQNDCGSGVYLLLYNGGRDHEYEALYSISDDFIYQEHDRDDVEDDFYKLISCAFEQFDCTITREDALNIGYVYRETSWCLDEKNIDKFPIKLDKIRF